MCRITSETANFTVLTYCFKKLLHSLLSFHTCVHVKDISKMEKTQFSVVIVLSTKAELPRNESFISVKDFIFEC